MYKKPRGKNFTEDEKTLLLDLVVPFKDIVENLKTDNVWKHKKDEVWERILEMYNNNTRQNSGIRNVSQLKTCYSTIKREAKKENSNKNVEMYKNQYHDNLLANIDDIEVDMLIDLIIPHKYIIEKSECPEKIDAIWKTIQESYNSQATSGHKSVSDLQYMYSVNIKEAKSNKRKNKEEIYKTGGGQSSHTLSTVKEKVMSLIGDKLNPLYNDLDCDTAYRALTVENPIEKNIIKVMTVETVYDDTGLYNGVQFNEEQSDETMNENCIDTGLNKSVNLEGKMEELSEEMISENYRELNQFSPSQKSQQETFKNQNPSIEIKSTKKTPIQSSSKEIYEGLNKLADQRLLTSNNKSNMERELYELKIKKAKISLETAELEKQIMQQKLIAQQSEVRQNEIKEQLLLSELNSKRGN